MSVTEISSKRAMSDIVSTILIILVASAAVAIVAMIVVPMIRTNLKFSNVEVDLLITDAVFDVEQNSVFIVVKRGMDEYNLTGINVLITIDGSSKSYEVRSAENLVMAGGGRVYQFENLNGVPSEASVMAFVKIGSSEKLLGISSRKEVLAGTWKGAGAGIDGEFPSAPPSFSTVIIS